MDLVWCWDLTLLGRAKIDFERIDKIDSAWADEPILRGCVLNDYDGNFGEDFTG